MKIAIVTGASSGMGRECAIQIGDRFPAIRQIWVIARRGERLEELATRIPSEVRCFALDITRPQALEELKEALRKEEPEVKILVNGAGYGKIGRVGEMDPEQELGMVRLNCEALCAVTHLVLPYMSRNSRVIQFASAASFLPQPGFAVYAATKSFVLSYSRALAEELRDREICVTAVCPGPVKTEFFDIAETDAAIPLYKRLVMADPRKVVRKAMRDSMAGRPVSVYGITMKAFRLLAKAVPHGWILAAMRRPGQPGESRRADQQSQSGQTDQTGLAGHPESVSGSGSAHGEGAADGGR